MPDHPGQSFTVDILKACNKKILVATDNFSGFISTVFVPSEKQEDLNDGVIMPVTTFKAATMAKIRVDQAPAFKALTSKPSNLRDVGIVTKDKILNFFVGIIKSLNTFLN